MTEIIKKTAPIKKSEVITNRKKTRKLLFQELYSSVFNKFEKKTFEESFYNNVFTFNIDEKYLNEMKNIIINHESFFISLLKEYSPKFDIKTMSISYILPVYIWLAEMFFLTEEIPWEVSINEAVEIAKVYWDNSSKRIVNWILNKVFKNHEKISKIKDNDYNKFTESCFK